MKSYLIFPYTLTTGEKAVEAYPTHGFDKEEVISWLCPPVTEFQVVEATSRSQARKIAVRRWLNDMTRAQRDAFQKLLKYGDWASSLDLGIRGGTAALDVLVRKGMLEKRTAHIFDELRRRKFVKVQFRVVPGKKIEGVE